MLAECKLYEANVAPWFFTYDGITPIRRAQASQFMPFNEPYLLNPYNLTGTYYSSATGIADVNPETGEVTIHGGGTVEIGISGTAGSTSYELDIDRLDPQISWSTGSYSTTLISGSPTGQPYLLNPNNVSPITYWSTDESKAVVDDEGGIGVVGVGGCSIFASFSGSAEYYPASVKYDLTITKGERIDPNLSFATDSASVTFDDTYYLPNTLNNPYNVPITVSISPYIVDAYVIDGQLWVEQNLATGTTTITASFDGDDYYLSGSASYDLTVEKGNPNLSWSSSYYDATISGTNDFPTLSNPHNLGPIDIWSSDWNIATISATGTINLVSTGSCGITAYYAGDDNWNAEGVYYTLNVVEYDYSQDYFTIEPLENGTINCWLAADRGSCQYSTDKINWYDTPDTLSVTQGQNIYLKSENDDGSLNYGIGTITSTCDFNVSGNIMSLIYRDNFAGQTSLSSHYYQFENLFYGNTHLINAQNLVLPATVLDYSCYAAMFYGCSSLLTTPSLPASTLANYCYQEMFSDCTSLTTAPQLPATTLANGCYYHMFYGCTSLTTAPALNASTLAESCYSYMFYGCTSLITPPALNASTLANSCYYNMFAGCSSLAYAPELPATTLASYCYYQMFSSCTSLTTAPELPATTLESNCYNQMFAGCDSLTYIKCLATNVSATNCTTNWTKNIASSGTFVKNPNMSSWTTGVNGIPSGWTVVDASN